MTAFAALLGSLQVHQALHEAAHAAHVGEEEGFQVVVPYAARGASVPQGSSTPLPSPQATRSASPTPTRDTKSSYSECFVREEVDRDSDGSIDEIREITYNALGDPTLVVSLDGTGTITNSVVGWHYRDTGQAVGFTVDRAPIGSLDYAERWSYSDDRLVRKDIDADGDSFTDYAWHYEYNALSLPAAILFDDGDDGVFDSARYYQYDSRGLLQKELYDADMDGVFDSRLEYAWRDELLESVSLYTGDNETPDWMRVNLYDSRGLVVTERWLDADGNVSAVHEYVFDELGRLTQTDYFRRGRWEFRTTYAYDEWGRRLSVVREGEHPDTRHLAYRCPGAARSGHSLLRLGKAVVERSRPGAEKPVKWGFS